MSDPRKTKRLLPTELDRKNKYIEGLEMDKFLSEKLGAEKVKSFHEAVAVYSAEWARDKILEAFHEVGITPQKIAQVLYEAMEAMKDERRNGKDGSIVLPAEPHWNVRLRAVEIASRFIDLKEPESDKPDKFDWHIYLNGMTPERMRFCAVYGRFPTEAEEKKLLADAAGKNGAKDGQD